MRPDGLQALVKGDDRAAERLQRQGAGHVRQLDQPLGPGECEGPDRGQSARAVDQGESLLSLQRDRRETGASQRLTAGQALSPIAGLALADQDQGQVGERGQVAAGPDGAALGDDRVHLMIEEIA